MRDWLIKDFWWKIFSVVLAVAVWLTMHNYRFESETGGESGVEITYSDVPVMAVSVPPDRHVRIVPTTVSVEVSGPRNLMAILQANELRPLVNLNGTDSGRNLWRSVEVAVRTGVTVIKIDPPEVAVTVSSLTETNQIKQP